MSRMMLQGTFSCSTMLSGSNACSVSSGAMNLLDGTVCSSKSRVAKAHEMLQRLQQQVLARCWYCLLIHATTEQGWRCLSVLIRDLSCHPVAGGHQQSKTAQQGLRMPDNSGCTASAAVSRNGSTRS